MVCGIGIYGMKQHTQELATMLTVGRGPLVFCLLLSLFLSMRASKDQKDLVFSGVFTLIWVGESVVALQIKLLGGNM